MFWFRQVPKNNFFFPEIPEFHSIQFINRRKTNQTCCTQFYGTKSTLSRNPDAALCPTA
jgi:hypothetical protein